jgi:GR25 family glycosyltransferase involved in LPS biosynthesis
MIYIIHYTPYTDRKESIFRQLDDVYFIEKYDREQLTDISMYTGMKLTNISLIEKHIEAWRLISQSADPFNYNLILEDDAILADNFKTALQLYIQQIPDTYDMVFLGDGCGFHIPDFLRSGSGNIFLKGNEPSWWGGDGATRCTDSYLISKKCCAKLLEAVYKKPISLPIDFLLNSLCRELALEVYWAEPTIVTQGFSETQNKSLTYR